jgi:hypothetical protein
VPLQGSQGTHLWARAVHDGQNIYLLLRWLDSKKDSEYLSRGREWLAAEMALVTDEEISDATRAIDQALADGMESAAATPPSG